MAYRPRLERGGRCCYPTDSVVGVIWLSLLPCTAHRETFFPVHVITMDLNLYCLSDDAFHESSFCGHNPGVLKLDTVTQVSTVFSHSSCVRMIQPDVLVVLLHPGLSRTPGLTNVDLTTFAGNATDASCFQAKVILHGPKEAGDLPKWEANSPYVALH